MNYGELRAHIKRWTKRTDLDDSIDLFIELGESMLRREIRTQEMLVSPALELTVRAEGSVFVDLPADCEQIYEFYRPGHNRENERWITITEASPTEYRSWPNTQSYPPNPSLYVRRGLELELNATTQDTLRMYYYQTLPALTAQAPTNWLSVKYPDLYVFGCLTQAQPWMKDDARMQTIDAMWSRAVKSTQEADWRDRQSQSGSRRTTVGRV